MFLKEAGKKGGGDFVYLRKDQKYTVIGKTMNNNVQVLNIALITQSSRIVSTLNFIPRTATNKITLQNLQIYLDFLRLTPEQNVCYVVVLVLILLETEKTLRIDKQSFGK